MRPALREHPTESRTAFPVSPSKVKGNHPIYPPEPGAIPKQLQITELQADLSWGELQTTMVAPSPACGEATKSFQLPPPRPALSGPCEMRVERFEGSAGGWERADFFGSKGLKVSGHSTGKEGVWGHIFLVDAPVRCVFVGWNGWPW